jgi:hypothetical protein
VFEKFSQIKNKPEWLFDAGLNYKKYMKEYYEGRERETFSG